MSDDTKERGRLAEEILDRLAADADFRQELLNDPTGTLSKLGYNTGEGVSGYGAVMSGALGAQTTAISCGCEPPGQVAGGGEPSTTWITCGENPPPGATGEPSPASTWPGCGVTGKGGSVNL